MTTTREQNERWATALFGWSKELDLEATRRYNTPIYKWRGDGYAEQSEAPDFASLTGPYFGPAVKELLDAGWVLTTSKLGDGNVVVYSWWRHRSHPAVNVTDPDLSICTMLALEAQRKESA